jgi:hypothetical protein
MATISLVIIGACASIFPAIFLYAFIYELRTGKEFCPTPKASSLAKEHPVVSAIVLLAILSNLALVVGGMAFFAQAGR